MTDGLQHLMDELSRGWRAQRSLSQMTLGGLMERLREFPPNAKIVGIGFPMSYRGYYSDLSFEPSEEVRSVEDVVKMLETKCLGKEFTGYKGGEYFMDENTPIWIAEYGNCGVRIMKLNGEQEPITFVTAAEEATP